MKKELIALREAMKAHGIDAYIIPTADFHGSEYVGDYFKCRSYVSGFTGSAGTLVVLADEAGLWTDGRYFLQAGEQLAGSGITLMKMAMPGTPTILDFLKVKLPAGAILGFDGRVVAAADGSTYEEILKEKGGCVRADLDLVGEIWADRPALRARQAYLIDESRSGMTFDEKRRIVLEAMEKEEADVFLLTSLDDIAWLFNMRGDDVDYNPVVLSYVLMTKAETRLYANLPAFGEEIRRELSVQGVTLLPYDQIYTDVTELSPEQKVLLEREKVNYRLLTALPEGIEVISRRNPTTIPKAAKTEAEQAGSRAAHIRDGVAVTKFLYWLKKHVGKEPMTEISIADKLESFRKQQEGYLTPSFETISGYGPHAAIVHYSATPETDAEVFARGMILIDSGGQYVDGTTDITRTVVLGPVTEEEKKAYTLVLAGHLRLGNARFLKGCGGSQLDILTREPLWRNGLDYRHGTGHGVGSFLNVHEAPNRINYNARTDWEFMPGMITSDEPGYYEDGKFGIRTENLILCVPDQTTGYGEFLKFEWLTLVPIDQEAIDTRYLTEEEIGWLNDYHAKVRETVGPFLTEEERAWLMEETKPLTK